MTAGGPADPFDTKQGFFKRLFGGRKPVPTDSAIGSAPPEPTDSPAVSTDQSQTTEEITVEGSSVEEVLEQLGARGVTEVDESMLRSSIGDKHPSVIKVVVDRTRKTVVHRPSQGETPD
jgi:hypothetical protein